MSSPQQPQRVAVLALEGAYPFELGIPSRIFEAVPGLYAVATCSVDGGPVRTASDFSVTPGHGPELLEQADIVIVTSVAAEFIPATLGEATRAALTRVRPGARMVSICTAAFILAAAGLLDGRPATTHWRLTSAFRERYPQVRLDPDVLFVDDGDVLTSAGAASGVDVCLHIVRSDHGAAVANAAARQCVVPPFRDGGQAQYIEAPLPAAGEAGTAAARAWALENLGAPLDLAAWSRRAGMSARTFSRRFVAEAGVSPGKWLVAQRVARARSLLETTDLAVDQVASRVGFTTGASLRQHFQSALGVSPSAYRGTFSAGRAS
ncbi:MAG: helix-turn-helix domain-containing protein [Arthrobacter sp.]|jgi:transcriptional regulator GlxA family with amidase domain|nr:helix-turn-helix domain-containing protein [Arthrobacter sp.]